MLRAKRYREVVIVGLLSRVVTCSITRASFSVRSAIADGVEAALSYLDVGVNQMKNFSRQRGIGIY